jgi:hypothetical protein
LRTTTSFREDCSCVDDASREAFESAWESNEEIDTEDGFATVRYANEPCAGQATCIPA